MVDSSYAKKRLNERGPYIFDEWPCANKRNKSVGTLNSGRRVVHITSAKILTIHFYGQLARLLINFVTVEKMSDIIQCKLFRLNSKRE